ncbi:MAG: prolipoprotein diacylglyceryl transferase, partial [Alphaproteobacteria bacterium]
VLVEFGPFAIRWYALAYVAGLLLGWRYARWMLREARHAITPVQVDDFLMWALIGVVLGGRLGYVLFYQPGFYLAEPLRILFVWQGGMSFHGGAVGVVVALWLFARKRHIPVLPLADAIAAAAPIGLFFGRIANFVNGELFGRLSDAPWAVVFPGGGPWPRHPSQIYEALLEGAFLFAVLYVLLRHTPLGRRPGAVTGVFVAGYGVTRFVAEMFREPDAHIGFLAAGATMGQVLSLPMIVGGVALIAWAVRRRQTPAGTTGRS